jgi:hypothetical protein
LGTWQAPPVYAIVARNQHAIHFRCAAPPTANPDKYADELLDDVRTHRRCGRALCGVRSSRRVIHTRDCQHAMALARACSLSQYESSRGSRFGSDPSALGKSDYRPSGASPAVMLRTGMHVVDPECGTPLV